MLHSGVSPPGATVGPRCLKMTTRCIIGLSSGSSADGVDAALVEIEGAGLGLRVRPVLTLHQPYHADLRDFIRRTSNPGKVDGKQTALLHRLLGETFAAAARQAADRASMSLQKVQCLGCPGHTVWDEPEGRFPSTFALGMAAVLAERTGVTTVSDFRSRDVAVGGQGMPLAALVDHLLFRHAEENRVLLHLGGAAGVVYLPGGGRPTEALGFEAGPCNLLLDGLMQHLTGGREEFDTGGKHGVQGRCLEPLLPALAGTSLSATTSSEESPRQLFGDEFLAQAVQATQQLQGSLHDVVCTATHFVARVDYGRSTAVLAGWATDSSGALKRWRCPERPALVSAGAAARRYSAGQDRRARRSHRCPPGRRVGRAGGPHGGRGAGESAVGDGGCRVAATQAV